MASLQTDRAVHPKSVVFTHFSAAQALICERLATAGIRYAQIAAGSSQRQRAKALHAFTATGDETPTVLVLSMKARATPSRLEPSAAPLVPRVALEPSAAPSPS